MPKDSWRTSSRAYRNAVNQGKRLPKSRRKKRDAKPPWPNPEQWYTVRAGTECHVRKMGEDSWRPHRTRKAIAVYSFLWRNEHYYGFHHTASGLEVRVKVGEVIVGDCR